MGNGDFFLKGNIYTIIMCALYTPDENGGGKYGYEIVRDIKERTGSKYEIKQPTLYSYLKRLEQQGQIISFWGTESNGGRRRYYKLTPKGRRDCSEFLNDWEYHKDMLGTLVDKADLQTDVSQEGETFDFDTDEPYYDDSEISIGEKLEEQDEISRRLAALFAASKEQSVKKESETIQANSVEEPEVQNEDYAAQEQEDETDESAKEETIELEEDEIASEDEIETPQEDVTEESNDENEQTDETSTETEESDDESVVSAVAAESPKAPEEVVSEQLATTTDETPTTPAEDPRAKFDVRQDDADDFIQKFEERARVISESRDPRPENNENYQHVLMNVIGDQLEEMQDYNSEQREGAQKYYTDHPVALEDVADELAKQGIRMRIYNHTSASYKSKTLMPVSGVICKAAWLTFAVIAAYFAILACTTIATDSWRPFVITLAVIAVVPIALTIFALYDPSRKEKPTFKFNRYMLAAGILAAIIVLASLGISIISGIELNDYVTVSKQILLPIGIAAIFPLYVAIFQKFYKKY